MMKKAFQGAHTRMNMIPMYGEVEELILDSVKKFAIGGLLGTILLERTEINQGNHIEEHQDRNLTDFHLQVLVAGLPAHSRYPPLLVRRRSSGLGLQRSVTSIRRWPP